MFIKRQIEKNAKNSWNQLSNDYKYFKYSSSDRLVYPDYSYEI